MDIGNNIRNYRKKFHLTQEKLADLSGLSTNFISRVERTNDQNVSLKTLIKLAEAFNITVADLVKGVGTTVQSHSVDELTLQLSHLDEATREEVTQSFLNIMKHI